MTFSRQVVGEFSEVVRTGIWVGDCFIYTNSVNRLNYYVGGEIVTISHLDRFGPPSVPSRCDGRASSQVDVSPWLHPAGQQGLPW